MNELALFAGIGGGLLGTRLLGWRTVCAVEIEPYAREVLLRRQRDGVLSMFPMWDDVRTFRMDNPECGEFVAALREVPNLVVTGGFPCQPFSTAGERCGEDDPRNLWPECIRIIREVGPRYCLLENVAALRSPNRKETPPEAAYFGRVVSDLADSGFRVRYDCISAADVGANHKRNRVWILADADDRCGESGTKRTRREKGADSCGGGQGSEMETREDTDADVEHGDRCGHGTGTICGERPEPADSK